MLRASWLVTRSRFDRLHHPQGRRNAQGMRPRTASNDVRLGVEQVASGLDQPVYLTAPVSDPRLFIVEQPGRIRVVEDGKLLDKPFLDIVDKVRSGGEQGLLSVAFHPQYRTNGFLFVNHTDKNGDTRIERYTVSSDRNVADPRSAKVILTIDQRYSNHQGGLNLFGPDGMLYIGMGDGGSQGDPHGNGQNRNVLLGKLLRLNVDRGDPYMAPAANPYVKGGGQSRNLGARSSQSVALRVRSFFRAALHRGRWPGPVRGSQRRSHVDRRRELRLEHNGRPVVLPVVELRSGGAAAAGGLVLARKLDVFRDRRFRVSRSEDSRDKRAVLLLRLLQQLAAELRLFQRQGY